MLTLLLSHLRRARFVAATLAISTASFTPAQAREAAAGKNPAAVTPAAKCSKCQRPIAQGTLCDHCLAECPAAAPGKTMPLANTGNVYTLDNDPTKNSLVVFTRMPDGSLAEVSGSPVSLMGKGLSGGDIDEQGAVRVHGNFVLAVNPGSDSVAVLRKTASGLAHVPGSPFPSGGSTPLSLTVFKDLVYVANQAAPFASPKHKPNITGFRMNPNGSLAALPGTTVEFPVGQGPAQVEFSPTGKTLAVSGGFQADDASRIYTFKVEPNGKLMAGPHSPIAPKGASGTVGFSWSNDGKRLFASLFKGSAVIAFDVDPMTAAIQQGTMPVGDDQQAACWTVAAPDGRTLYVGNFVSNSISVYDIAEKQPVLLGSVPRRGATNKDTKDIALSADGKYLYAIGSGARQVSVFHVEANRLLTELPKGQSPTMIATGQNSTGLAVD